ncbi:hypothetical protein HDU96_008109 [Phlyctochytrium bullatum]|nr:hypothetical protein HDU96_008109 [Phlyctochytrium bullatum]
MLTLLRYCKKKAKKTSKSIVTSVASDADDDDDSGLDDEEMNKYDEKLAEIFRIKSDQKKAKKEAKVAMAHVKLRYCDLVDALLKKQSWHSVTFQTLPKVLKLINSSTGNEVSAKLESMVRKRLCHKRPSDNQQFEASEVKACLESIHMLCKHSRKAPDKKRKISSLSMVGVDASSGIESSYNGLIQDFLNNRKTRLHAGNDTAVDAYSRNIDEISKLMLQILQLFSEGKDQNLRGMKAERLKELFTHAKVIVKVCKAEKLSNNAWQKPLLPFDPALLCNAVTVPPSSPTLISPYLPATRSNVDGLREPTVDDDVAAVNAGPISRSAPNLIVEGMDEVVAWVA